MKSTSPNYPHPFRAVREFGQLKALKFATLLQLKSERLSTTTKYLTLWVFVAFSIGASSFLLFSTTASFNLENPLPDTHLHYFTDHDTIPDPLIPTPSLLHSQNSHD